MTNEFLPKIKSFKEQWKEKKEEDLSDDDIIAILDKYLQRDIDPSPDDQLSPKDKKDKNEPKEQEQRSDDVQTPIDEEIEQISESHKKKLEELDKIYKDAIKKSEDLDKLIARVKRKEPPKGDISDKALTVNQEIKKNWFEVDV